MRPSRPLQDNITLLEAESDRTMTPEQFNSACYLVALLLVRDAERELLLMEKKKWLQG